MGMNRDGAGPGVHFSDRAIGVISNHGDHHFYEFLWDRLVDLGIRNILYLGPLAPLTHQIDHVISLMEKHNLRMVYGRSDILETNTGIRELPPGEIDLRLGDVLFRYFVPTPSGDPHGRLWELLFGTSQEKQQVLLVDLLRRTNARILVIGSGFEIMHITTDSEGKNPIFHRYRFGCQWAEHERDRVIRLDPAQRHILVTPSSRSHAFCVLDPERNLLAGYYS